MQVEVSHIGDLQCPITLECPPTVPVVTACGHIFSLPAIVHCMLDAGGETFTQAALCPLCFTPVSARDLRLVSVRTIAPPPSPGDTVSLVLLRRARDSIIPEPVAPPCAPALTARASGCAGVPSPLSVNKFAKFVEVSDALPTMRAAATELAKYAAIIVAGGGTEAAVEGPSLFKSMDLLAAQARVWTMRRLEERSAGAIVGAYTEDSGARAAGAEAEMAVRDVFEVQMADERTRAARAAEAEEESRRMALREAARNDVFPSLPGDAVPGSERSRSGVWGRGSADASPTAADDGALQFDLDEGDGGDPPGGEARRRSGEDAGVAGAAGEAASPVMGSLEESMRLLGTSPNTGLSVNQVNEGDFYMYQAEDGQWLFLHPINVRSALRAC